MDPNWSLSSGCGSWWESGEGDYYVSDEMVVDGRLPEKSCVQIKVREYSKERFMSRGVQSLVADGKIVLDIEGFGQDAVQDF